MIVIRRIGGSRKSETVNLGNGFKRLEAGRQLRPGDEYYVPGEKAWRPVAGTLNVFSLVRRPEADTWA